jgi:hypothetical protein
MNFQVKRWVSFPLHPPLEWSDWSNCTRTIMYVTIVDMYWNTETSCHLEHWRVTCVRRLTHAYVTTKKSNVLRKDSVRVFTYLHAYSTGQQPIIRQPGSRKWRKVLKESHKTQRDKKAICRLDIKRNKKYNYAKNYAASRYDYIGIECN